MSRISWNTFLASMLEVGYREYIETTLDKYLTDEGRARAIEAKLKEKNT